MEDMKKLLDKITVENIIIQKEDGWTSSFVIAEYIVGIDVWKYLSGDDRMILATRVNRISRANNLVDHILCHYNGVVEK